MKHTYIFEIETNMCAENTEKVVFKTKTQRLAYLKLNKLMNKRNDIFYWHINSIKMDDGVWRCWRKNG